MPVLKISVYGCQSDKWKYKDASAINENKWISIVKYGCQCNKWK